MLVSSWHFPLITKSSLITTLFEGYSIETVGFSVSTASPRPTSQAEKIAGIITRIEITGNKNLFINTPNLFKTTT